MRGPLRRLLRRRRTVVLVDLAAYQATCAWAVLGEAQEIISAESARWHNLDMEETSP